MTTDFFARARAGDGAAFRELTEPYRRELHVHCYRMLASLEDADDAVQETFAAAWQALGSFEGRASTRTWLYKIATNRCLNMLRSARRRQAKAWDSPGIEPPAPSRMSEVPWLEPIPDALLPDVAFARSESISLTFVAALAVLPHRQIAVLLLGDVIGFEASEIAEMLDATTDSVNSAMKRARANLETRLERGLPPPPRGTAAEQAVVAAFVRAYEAGDVEALVALLTDEAFISMPPVPLEYVGRDAAKRFCQLIFREGRRFDLVPTRANGQPAFAAYLRSSCGERAGSLIALTLAGERISAMTRFEGSILPRFGLPA